jgi:RNA polymerase sigma-70 factor (ECF subfamily)
MWVLEYAAMLAQPKRGSARLTLKHRERDQLAYPTLSDLVLAVRARDGDRRALETLVERHAPGVRRLAGYLLQDPQDAEDAAQEALAKLCTRIGQFRGEAQFATWLYSLVANTCRDLGLRQRRRRHQPLELVTEAAGRDEPVDIALQRDQRRALRDSLAALSHEQRHVMVMKDVLSLSYEEIAGVLRMPVGTVKCHAHRGRARMRRAIESLRQAAGA